MRIVFLSDTHNKLSRVKVPDGDLLIHCGDFCGRGTIEEVKHFNEEMNKLPHKHKVVIAGNHDWPFLNQPQLARSILSNMIYLEDSETEIEGLRIYGSPWQPEFFNWAFNLPRCGVELKRVWDDIPDGTDILITHGPPAGILDLVPPHKHAGCELLLERVNQLKPRIHCFGHIHPGYGMEKIGETTFVNAANLNDDYMPTNEPLVIDL